jgi:dimethylargininase
MSRTSRAFVRHPSARLCEGELTHIARQPLALEKALQQYASYLALLRAHGYALLELPELPEHPDGLFVEDALLMIDGRAILTRPGAASRRDEVLSIEPALRALQLPSARIEPPATLDGGDVLVLDRHILVGHGTRTNAAGRAQLAALTADCGREVLGVEVSGALHLKTALTRLPDGRLIVAPERVDTAALIRLGYSLQHAHEDSAADVLCLGDTVVLPADAPTTASALRAQGLKVATLDISELQKLEAGLTCMSVLF